MSQLRRVVLVLLMLALPVQAAVAAARTLCAAAGHHANVVATTAHAPHAHDHGVAQAPAGADGSLPGDASVAADTCKLCAACGLTAAAPPAALSLSALPMAEPGHPAIHVQVPRNVADGLERPPRTE